MIFDCDGVLVDSERVANRVMTHHLQAAGLRWEYSEVCHRFTGRSMASCVVEIESELGRRLPVDWVEQVQQETFAAFREDLQEVPGVRRLIDVVTSRGWASCVASSGEHEKIAFTLSLTGLLDRFHGRVFSSSDVSNGKPAPDLFLHAATSMGYEPEDCWVIEDSAPGVAAARAAGMRVFGYTAGVSRNDLLEAGAEVFADMAQFADRLSSVTEDGTS